MLLIKVSLTIIVVCMSSVLGEKVSFGGYKLIKIFPSTSLHLEAISKWEHYSDVNYYSTLVLVIINLIIDSYYRLFEV
jgi:hypothetical protein